MVRFGGVVCRNAELNFIEIARYVGSALVNLFFFRGSIAQNLKVSKFVDLAARVGGIGIQIKIRVVSVEMVSNFVDHNPNKSVLVVERRQRDIA